MRRKKRADIARYYDFNRRRPDRYGDCPENGISGWRMPALTAEEDELLAVTPAEELLKLPLLQLDNIRDTLHAYQMAKRCNGKRVMAEAVKWGRRGARINDTFLIDGGATSSYFYGPLKSAE